MKISNFTFIPLLITVVGCASNMSYPSEQNVQGANESFISIANANEGATVIIDGKNAGTIDKNLKAPDKFSVTPGTHGVSVLFDGNTLYSNKVFVSSGSTAKVVITK